MALEKSRAYQQIIDFGASGNNMVQQHVEPSQQNIIGKEFIVLPDKQFRSFTVQNISLPGSTMSPLGESNILRNEVHQIQSLKITSRQDHYSNNTLSDKLSGYLTAGNTNLLSSSIVNPSIENYIQSNAIHQHQSLENVMPKELVLSETHNTSCKEAHNYCVAAATDEQIRSTSDQVVRSLSQPTSKSTRIENYHLDSTRFTAENSTEKPKKRGRPRKEAKLNGEPKQRGTKGKENVKTTSPKGACTDSFKTNDTTYASVPSTGIAPRMGNVESKISDHDKYSGKTSKPTNGGIAPQATEPSVDPLDGIIQKIKLLSISRAEDIVAEIPQNALVPYEGVGALVAFKGKAKKIRSRAKVNIDPVTTMMWNLLIGPDMGDGAEGLDKDKEKWLDEERRVFKGRVDSFIARMHLVQGMETITILCF
jgi:hypothetical protein